MLASFLSVGRNESNGAPHLRLSTASVTFRRGLAIAVVYLLAAESQLARLVWNLAPSQLGLLAGFTLLGAGVGLMVAAVIYKKS